MSDPTNKNQPTKDIDELINDLRSVIQPSDHLGSTMMPGFMEETPYTKSDEVKPEISSDDNTVADATGVATPGNSATQSTPMRQGAIVVPTPPSLASDTTQARAGDKLTGAPLAEGLSSLAQAVDEQDKDLRTTYGAGSATDQGAPTESSERSDWTDTSKKAL